MPRRRFGTSNLLFLCLVWPTVVSALINHDSTRTCESVQVQPTVPDQKRCSL